MVRPVWLPLVVLLAAALPATLSLHWSAAERLPADAAEAKIRGRVISEAGPLAGASVGVKGCLRRVKTDAKGAFALPAPPDPKVRIVASKQGYFIAGSDSSGERPATIRLRPHPSEDCPQYEWIDPRPDPGRAEACGNCHRQIFREWSRSAHGQSAANRRFLNLYDGTDWQGNEEIGWNLLAEFPEGSGVCYSCHVPSLPPDVTVISDLRKTGGVHRQGIHCDFCHKITDVSIERVGLDHGRFAMRLMRPSHRWGIQDAPPNGRGQPQIFFGPMDDDDRGKSVYLPLYRESRYCASCHEGILFGAHAYSEYSEWLASRYAKQGVSCQDCHMAPTGRMTNVAPGHGGIDRDPQTLAGHRSTRFDPSALRAHLSLTLQCKELAEGLQVRTTVKVHDIGHRMPTGYPGRQLILWVQVTTGDGKSLELLRGPVLPQLAGQGPLDRGGLAGQPGRMYAKVFGGPHGEKPVPYWRAARLEYDTRLLPDEVDRRRFLFRQAEGDRRVTVCARLIYRRFSKHLADQKGWPDNEFLITRTRWSMPH